MPHQQRYMLTPVSIRPVSVRPRPCFCQLHVLRPLPSNPPPFHMFAFLPSHRGRSERLPDGGAAVVICLQPTLNRQILPSERWADVSERIPFSRTIGTTSRDPRRRAKSTRSRNDNDHCALRYDSSLATFTFSAYISEIASFIHAFVL